MTTITIDSGAITLTSPTYTDPVSIVSGVTIAGYYAAIYGATQAWTIDNSGYVHGTAGEGSYAFGIELKAGGSVTNNSGGTIAATAEIAKGIYISGAAGTVINDGLITAAGSGVIIEDGGIVTNAAGGAIDATGVGATGIYIAGDVGTVVNAGVITSGGYGVRMYAGGSFTNAASGHVQSQQDGIDLSGNAGTISNDGTIMSIDGRGVKLSTNTGTIDNSVSGTIGSYLGGTGILLDGGAADISNAGTIQANFYAIDVAANSTTITNTGLILVQVESEQLSPSSAAIRDRADASLTVSNMAGGTISDQFGDAIDISAASVAIVNAGLITASGTGILAGSYSTALYIDNTAGGIISGDVGIDAMAGASLSFTIANAGTIQGGQYAIVTNEAASTITNAGLIANSLDGSQDTAVEGGASASSLVIDNLAGGTINSTYGVGIDVQASDATITNFGLIYGGAPAIVVNTYVTNVDITNEAGATIQGVFGVYFGASDSTITNQGAIAGYAYGIQASPPASGDSIINQSSGTISAIHTGIALLGANGTITNQGHIHATDGYGIYAGSLAAHVNIANDTGGMISGGGGVGLYGAGDTLVNDGAIVSTGTAYVSGVYIGGGATNVVIENLSSGGISAALQGIYVSGSDSTIINDGSIQGGSGYAAIYAASAATGLVITNAASATVSGGYGVVVEAAGVSISNSGQIVGSQFGGIDVTGADAVITNQGLITSTGFGVVVDAGGSFANAAGGQVSAAQDGIDLAGATGTITNDGTISSLDGNGIDLTADTGTITNAAAGLIQGGTAVVLDGGTADVGNAGTIQGNFYGVVVDAADSTITNTGLITIYSQSERLTPASDAIEGMSGATGLVIDNMSGGTISNLSGVGVAVSGSGDAITNQGLITASASGIVVGGPATGVDITNDSGAVISADVGVGVYSVADAVTISNAGTVNGGHYGVLIDAADSTITNTGLISNTYEGSPSVAISGGSNATGLVIDNMAGGTITSSFGVGIYVRASDATITNLGLISADNAPAVLVRASLTDVNITNETGATIQGFYGVYFGASDSTITNQGVISGSGTGILAIPPADQSSIVNLEGGTISAAHVGISVLGTDFSITNQGVINGTANYGISAFDLATNLGIVNEAGGTISGLTGLLLTCAGATVTNQGEVTGGGTGFSQYQDGIYLRAAGDSITNDGTITAAEGFAIDAGSLATTLVINNDANAVISGDQGLHVNAAGAVITNQGLIESTPAVGYFDAVFTGESATGVTLTNDAGATISGQYGVYIGGADSTITNAGLIETPASGHYGVYGGHLAAGLQVTNAVGGTISGAGGVAFYAAGQTLTNQGVIAAVGSDRASGVFVSSYASNAVIENLAGGTISGFHDAVYAGGTDVIVTNAGLIEAPATGHYGIYGGTAATGLQVTNEAGGTISGGGGVGLYATGDTLVNQGDIISTGTAHVAGVYVRDGASNVVIENMATGSISAVLQGMYVSGTDSTIVNHGVIVGGAGYAGVYAAGYSTGIQITNDASATISGGVGVDLGGGNGSLTNAGVISGTGAYGLEVGGADCTVNNTGLIVAPSSGHYGVYGSTSATGLQVNNEIGGTITGRAGVAFNAADNTLVNAGSILASGMAKAIGVYIGSSASNVVIENLAGGTITGGADGVYVGGTGGAVVNQGAIYGSPVYAGIYAGSYATGVQITNDVGATASGGIGVGFDGAHDTLVNDGQIRSTGDNFGFGMYSGTDAGYLNVMNNAGATISGTTGIAVYGGHNTITNQGVIAGSSSALNAGIFVATLAADLGISNDSSGTISGAIGIDVAAAGVTVFNQGAITSTGVQLQAQAGIYVSASATGFAMTNAAGGLIDGVHAGVELGAVGAILVNQGVIAGGDLAPGTGVYTTTYATSVQITNDANGTITGQGGIYIDAANSTLTNYGQIIGGTTEFHTGVYSGVSASSLSILNAAGGTIVGATGIYISYVHNTITNQGAIAGTTTGSHAGVYAGMAANYLQLANESGATISGAYGISIESSGDTITNAGSIHGAAYDGIYQGTGGELAQFHPNIAPVSLSIDNQDGGTISGFTTGVVVESAIVTNESGALITGGDGGVVFSGIGTLMNAGTILGGTVGTAVSLSAGGTVENAASGTIIGATGVYMAGTLTNAGTIVGSGGTAVAFANNVSSLLVVDPGAVFTGLVDGGTDGSALELAAGSSTGTLDGLGVSFTNFTSVTFDSGASWFVTGGADTLGVGSTLTNDGLVDLRQANLQDAGAVANSYLLELQGSTLAASGLTGAGTTLLDDGSTLSVQGTIGSGQIVLFDAPDTSARLVLGNGADMAGIIANFGVGDVIDVANLAFSAGSTATVSGNVMTVTNGSVTETFATSGLADGTTIRSLSDGVSGTDLMLGAPPPPAALTLAPGSDSGVKGDDITNDTTPQITGTGIAGDTVILYDGETAIGTGMVAGDGTWSIVTSTLSSGEQILTATQTAADGLVSGESIALTLTIDTTGPTAPAALTLAPGSDSGVKGDDITNDTTPQITGTGTAGDTVILYDGETAIGTATVAGDGTWSIMTSTLSAGAQILTATQTDVAGNVSAASSALTLTIDTTLPAAPAALTLAPGSDSGAKGDDITNDTTPQITGTGIAGDTVVLYDGETAVGTGTVAENGTWSIVTTTLSAGAQILTATETDIAGNVSAASSALTLTIDTTRPAAPAALTLAPGSDSGVKGDDITNDTTPQITGTGIAGDTVILYDGETAIGTGTVGQNGTWSITTSTLSVGAQILTATETDVAGNVSAASTALTLTIDTTGPAAPAALTLAPGSDSGVKGDDITNDTTPQITGTGTAGDTVILYDGETAIGTATVAGDGTWSIMTSTLSAGAQILTATQTDVAGNVSAASSALTLTIDTTLPAAPAALTLAPGSDSGAKGDDITNDTTPQITGTGIAGDTVVLYDGETAVGTGTVAENGTWSIVTTTLSAGAQILTATETDIAGNVSAASSALTLTIDTTRPAAPAALTLAPGSDSGVQGDDITDDTTPVITGTGVAGDSIVVYAGTTEVGVATVANDGTWSATLAALADGTYSLTATQTDIAGNVSSASGALQVTIVPVPTVPTLMDQSGGAGAAEPALAGTAPDNSVVSLYADDVLVGTATASSSGTWTFNFTTPLSVGNHEITATATDAAGDVSVLSAPLTVQIASGGGYTILLPPNEAGDVVSRIHDATGALVEVDTRNADQQLLQSVSNTQAILEIYDSAGKLIGTITQASDSAENQPVFETTGQTLSATTGSGPVGSVIDLLAESNVINSQGNDTVIAGPGADTIFAAGPTCSVTGGSGTLVYIGGTGTTTVIGGTGSSTVFGGSGGGHIDGGSAGHNVLVAGGGATTVLGGGSADVLVGGAGDALLAMDSGGLAFGGAGNNTLFGAAGGAMIAGAGTNLLIAGSGHEVLWGGGGSATLFGGSGTDLLAGGTGNATLVAGSGTTDFIGTVGNNTIWGGAGNTTVFGGSGSANVHLGSGSSTVVFADGHMSVAGGAGTDIYIVTQGVSDGGTDLISNFKVGTDQLRAFGFTPQDFQEKVSGGNMILTFNQDTTVTLTGVTTLAPDSVIFG